MGGFDRVLVAGEGMIPFGKPGQSLPCHEMGAQAVRRADRPAAQPGSRRRGSRDALRAGTNRASRRSAEGR
jgi:hypothetical protein